ncbi:hypothetical protein I7I48_03015 [Histoplasma ohiense]|nr:hypothetical protein I7I48_03015 [Histoplasma ohiense (nom. inval.)]
MMFHSAPKYLKQSARMRPDPLHFQCRHYTLLFFPGRGANWPGFPSTQNGPEYTPTLWRENGQDSHCVWAA